jgi:hypothetical protein
VKIIGRRNNLTSDNLGLLEYTAFIVNYSSCLLRTHHYSGSYFLVLELKSQDTSTSSQQQVLRFL